MCFSSGLLENFLIGFVIVCAVVAFVRLLLPVVLGWLGIAGDLVLRAVNILLVAFVVIALIVFVFQLLGCVGGFGRLR